MANRRSSLNWTKPFYLVNTRKDFDQIETTQELIYPQQLKKQSVVTKQEDIGTPCIQSVPRVAQPKSYAKITPNYIRLPAHLNLPSPDSYQLSEIDHFFLKSAADKFRHNDIPILTPEMLQKIIIQLQTKAGRDSILPSQKTWLINYLNDCSFKQILNYSCSNELTDSVYRYWRSRRLQMRHPMLRSLWKLGTQYNDHFLAFCPRIQKQKRTLRKASRIDQQQTLIDLHQQMTVARQLTLRLETRQQLELRRILTTIHLFNNENKAHLGPMDFLQDLPTAQIRTQQKNRIRNLQNNFEQFRNKHHRQQDEQSVEEEHQKADNRLSTTYFLAAVAQQIEKQKIQYQKIYPLEQKRDLNVPGPAPVSVIIPPKQIKEYKQTPPAQEALSLSIRRMDNLLIRCLEKQDHSESPKIIPPANYIDFRARRVSCYYFGDDDDGEFRSEFRKSIASSFKKFQQGSRSYATLD